MIVVNVMLKFTGNFQIGKTSLNTQIQIIQSSLYMDYIIYTYTENKNVGRACM